jgi:hypothetical protein
MRSHTPHQVTGDMFAAGFEKKRGLKNYSLTNEMGLLYEN